MILSDFCEFDTCAACIIAGVAQLRSAEENWLAAERSFVRGGASSDSPP